METEALLAINQSGFNSTCCVSTVELLSISVALLLSAKLDVFPTGVYGATFFKIEGRQIKSRRSIKLKGTVIGGMETPLQRLAIPDVSNALSVKLQL